MRRQPRYGDLAEPVRSWRSEFHGFELTMKKAGHFAAIRRADAARQPTSTLARHVGPTNASIVRPPDGGRPGDLASRRARSASISTASRGGGRLTAGGALTVPQASRAVSSCEPRTPSSPTAPLYRTSGARSPPLGQTTVPAFGSTVTAANTAGALRISRTRARADRGRGRAPSHAVREPETDDVVVKNFDIGDVHGLAPTAVARWYRALRRGLPSSSRPRARRRARYPLSDQPRRRTRERRRPAWSWG